MASRCAFSSVKEYKTQNVAPAGSQRSESAFSRRKRGVSVESNEDFWIRLQTAENIVGYVCD
jgi:hypothetical protein